MAIPASARSADRPRLAGRVALVTGGSRGAGAAIARALAGAGAAVIVAARGAEQAEAVAEGLRQAGASARAAECDVADSRSVEALARLAYETFGRVDILVNNAGRAGAAPIARTALADWNAMLAVNATGAFLCMQTFLPGMLERRWGRIVNIASTAGLTGDRYIAAYAASKHALVGLTRSVAAEVAGQGVTVNAVCPGFLATGMTDETVARVMSATGRSRNAALDALTSRNPQRRLFAPEEVAAGVEYLCGDLASGITGTMLVIDGGELRR